MRACVFLGVKALLGAPLGLGMFQLPIAMQLTACLSPHVFIGSNIVVAGITILRIPPGKAGH